MLLGANQKAKKLVRRGAQIADTAIRRQRTYVQQNSARSPKLHEADITGWIAVARSEPDLRHCWACTRTNLSATQALGETLVEDLSIACFSLCFRLDIHRRCLFSADFRGRSAASQSRLRMAIAGRRERTPNRCAGFVGRL